MSPYFCASHSVAGFASLDSPHVSPSGWKGPPSVVCLLLFTGSMQIPSVPLKLRGVACNSLFSEHPPFACDGGASVCLPVENPPRLFLISSRARVTEGTRAYVVFRNKTDVCVCVLMCVMSSCGLHPPQGKLAHCHSEHGLGTWPGALQTGPKM